jgi:two-component system chemotaxis sensor kinase CheA
MDDLLSEFLTETAESLDVVDNELVKFEQNPNNKEVLDRIFRLVHTIKGTCGFLGLSRLEAVAHASETLLGKFRDGAVTVSPDAVTLILASLDRIKLILARLEADEVEPAGDDSDLIAKLEAMAAGQATAKATGQAATKAAVKVAKAAKAAAAKAPDKPAAAEAEATAPAKPRFDIALGRPLTPGEVDLEELEAIFRETEGLPGHVPAVAPPAESASAADATVISAGGSAMPSDSPTSIANLSIRVNVDVIENLMTMVSELVLTRNQLLEMVRRMDDSEFKVPISRLSSITAELQEGVMKTRMQPIGNAWQKLPRIVRDLARELRKKIELDMVGAETELDRQVLELIKDPLTHMVRNSADHGLEMPAARKSSGKPEVGRITLKAYHEGGHIIIEVADDGHGLDTDRIKAKALQNGLASEAELEKMSEAQIHRFIFAAGFSTAAKVTNVSGRGVGMDVVRSNIEQIGGTIDLRSQPGQGTTFTIKIPLTLAIVSALIVGSAGQRYAIPQLSVLELVRAKPGSENRIERINRTPVLRLRNRLLPLVRLGRLLGIEVERPAEDDAQGFVVVTQVGAQIFGIVVDEVFDTEEIVVKPCASILRNIPMFSGNTILGDGSVIMIVDPNGVAQTIRAVDAEAAKRDQALDERHTVDEDRTSLLIFRAGTNEPKAVPLSLVTRLEEIEVEKIERSNGRSVVQYRGKLMPLVHVDDQGVFQAEGRQPILVFTDRGRAMGLVVDEIVDIVQDKLKIELAVSRAGLIGSAIIRGKATEIVDVGHFLIRAYADWFDDEGATVKARAKRVLFVDDSPFFRNMVAPLLSVAGYEVTTVESADLALKLKEEGASFDLVVSDIEMPGTDGLGFARKLRGDPSWADVPLIALSSLRSEEDRARGLEAGFNEYLAKFDRDALINTITQRLKVTGAAA